MRARAMGIVAAALIVTACATPYQRSGFSGGYNERHLEGDIWRVTFAGNGYTTRESAQTYWLYRCAELAIEKGFDGFEVLSNITLSGSLPPEEYFRHEEGYRRVGGTVYVPMYIPEVYKPAIEADIRLLRAPIEPLPPRVFDARRLKAALEPHVKGEKKCSSGNVCPHVHRYLHSDRSPPETGI